jgi:hypothetical protein
VVSKERVAFDEAMRLLRWQDTRLASLRSTALAITTSGAAVLTLALTLGVSGRWPWVAGGLLAVAVAAGVWLHLPTGLWDAFHVDQLVATYVDDEAVTEDEMLRDLALHAHALFGGNIETLNDRQRIWLVVVVAVAVELGAIVAAAVA